MVLILVIGGVAIVTQITKQNTDKTNTITQASDTSAAMTPTGQNKVPAVTIEYTDDGFTPSNITVRTGDTVKVVNKSSQSLEFASDPHPVHTKDADLNQQVLAAGQSQTFVVTKKGTYGYHDHLNASRTGTITIE